MIGGGFRRAVIVVACSILAVPDLARATEYVLPESLDPIARRPTPTMGPGRFLGCTAGGLVGGAMIGVGCGGLLGGLVALLEPDADGWGSEDWGKGLAAVIVGTAVGYPLGSAVCVYGAGSTGDVGGSFGWTLFGSFLGAGLTGGLLWIASENDWSGTGNGTADWMLALAPTPVFATIAFAHTMRYDDLPPDAALAPTSRPDRLFRDGGAAGDGAVRVILARRAF